MLDLWFGDTRLVGTWKSDRERTASEIAARADIPPEKKAALAALFGKLEIRYTRWHAYSTFEGSTERAGYRVVAKDAESAAIVHHSATGKTIQHIHFEPDAYWATLGSSNIREFFGRVR